MYRAPAPKILVRLSAVRVFDALLIREDTASSSTVPGTTTFAIGPLPGDEGTKRRRALNRTVRIHAPVRAIGTSTPRRADKWRRNLEGYASPVSRPPCRGVCIGAFSAERLPRRRSYGGAFLGVGLSATSR